MDSLHDRVSFLKKLTGDIHDEVESHNRVLDRMGNEMDASRGIMFGTMDRFKMVFDKKSNKKACILAMYIVLLLLAMYYMIREHCDVLSMQIDSDLVIYQTNLLRTFQVVTICRVDKSEVLVVLISPHDSKHGAVPSKAARETSRDVEEGGAAVQRAGRGPCVARRRTMAHDGARLRRTCCGRMRSLTSCDFDGGAAAGRPPLRRVSGDVVTAGMISSRVWFGPVPGSP
ncbi:bet1-like SNARE 1-2-like [Dorcoceras hygrometricum]|uniref:Bet1-like SNARE 1-2-like n=1 Tax=Dorcoceras hygrometricum TaxID=472368 RepID=A0A2Z7B7W2_9LAMI|nr:bet1-like SNARE 1-2-like [Dorcoceras hygrometricum]